MKKIIKITKMIMMILVITACTNKKIVQYNTDRLDHIEEYLSANKSIKNPENIDKLVEEGKIEYSKEFKSLEREAEAWLENQQK